MLPNDKGTTYDRRSLTSANCMEQHFRLERGGETIVTLHRIFRRAMDVDQPDHIMSDAEVAQLNAVAEGRSVDSAADSGDDDDDDEAVGGGPALSLAGVWQQSSSDPLVPWLRAMSVDDALAELFESLAGRVRIQHSPSYLIVTDVTPTGRVSTALALGRAEFEAVMPEPDDEPVSRCGSRQRLRRRRSRRPDTAYCGAVWCVLLVGQGTGDDEVAKLNTPVTLMRAVCVDGEVVIATKLPEECGGGVTLDSRRLTGPDTMASHTRLVRDGVVVAHLRRSFTRMADVPQPPGAVPSRAAFERAAAQFPAHADSGDEATGEELAAPSLAELAQAGEAADVDAAPAAARATDVVIEAPRASRKRWARGAGARDSPRGEDRDVVTPLPSTPATSVGTAASRPTPSLDAARRSRGHSSPSLQLQDYRLASVGVLGLLFFVVMGMFVFSGSLLYSGLFVFVAAEFVVRVYRSCTRKRRRSQAASKAPPQPATGNAVQATAATAPMVEAAGSD